MIYLLGYFVIGVIFAAILMFNISKKEDIVLGDLGFFSLSVIFWPIGIVACVMKFVETRSSVVIIKRRQ